MVAYLAHASWVEGLPLLTLQRQTAELKTEEGYSADIYPWRYMSAQCRRNVRATSHERYMSHEGDVMRT